MDQLGAGVAMGGDMLAIGMLAGKRRDGGGGPVAIVMGARFVHIATTDVIPA